MINNLVLLESPVTTEAIWVAVILLALGFLCLWQGWVAYTEPIPRFVIHYNGGTCPPLAMPYGGAGLLLMGLAGLRPVLSIPEVIIGLLAPVWLFGGLTFLLGVFFWFPFFLLPPWYRRARRAGISRNDPNAMGAFKALSVEQQKAAARKGKPR